MTREQCTELTNELIEKVSERMKQRIDDAFMSGAINLDSFEDGYRLPRIILYALLEDERYRWKPLKRGDVSYAKNLYLCMP